MFNTRVIVYFKATVNAVSCLVAPAVILYLLIYYHVL